MAQALERYKRAGVLLADIPRLDLANFRERARSSANLDRRLGQLSEWALGEAVDRAKAEGLQYGAENPVTLRQLLDAQDVGGTPSGLQPRGTVFGDAARSMQAAALASDAEIDAQEQINRLKLGAERGEIDLPTAAEELRGLVEGTGKAMVNVDPKLSLKVRASLATSANAAYLSMAQSFAKKQEERKRVVVDDWISNTVPEQARAYFDAGDTIDPDTGKAITPHQRIVATLFSTLSEQLRDMPDEFARQADKRFGDALSRARINAVTAFVADSDFARGDPSAALSQIRRGELGKYAATWREMPADDQEKVVVNFMQEAGRRHTLDERATKQAEEIAKREVYDLLASYHTMRDGPAKDAQRRQIVGKGRGVLSLDQLKSLLDPPAEGGAKENVSLEVRAIDLVRRGGVTDLAEVQRRVPGLQPKQIKRLQDYIYDAGDRELRERVRALAGIPDGLVQMSGDQQRRYLALTAEMERIKFEEIEKNTRAGNVGMYNPRTVLGKLAEAKDRVTADKAVDAARTALDGYGAAKKARITENTSEQELKRLRFSAAEINEIRRRQRTIRGE